MENQGFDVHTATRQELLTQARDVMGLDGATSRCSVDELRDMVKAALGMPVEKREQEPEAKKNDGWPVVVISPGADGDARDVQVGVNGKIFLIQRGVEVAVPPAVLEVLRNAVKTTYPDSKTMKPVSRHSYPFSIVKA